MITEPYLTRLTARLLDGVERLPAEVRHRHATYLLASQNPDGGFSGREGGSDLYYTSFACDRWPCCKHSIPRFARKPATSFARK